MKFLSRRNYTGASPKKPEATTSSQASALSRDSVYQIEALRWDVA